MENKLCLILCRSLLPETFHLLQNGNYPDLCLKGLPGSCTRSNNPFEKAVEKVNNMELEAYSKIIIITGTCSGNKNLRQDLHPKIDIIRLEQCFEIFTSLPTIIHLIQQGSYLVTNGWLKNYKHYIREWGFDENSAKAFFGESIKKILLLETGLPGSYLPELKAVSSYMGVPFDVLPIGNKYLKMFVDTLVYKWRAETERVSFNDHIATLTRETADHLVLFSQMKRLIDLTDEDLILKEIATLLDILFMPQEIYFNRPEPGNNSDAIYFKKSTETTAIEADNFFTIDVMHKNELLGSYHVIGLQFPQYLKQYMSMKQVISQIGGLAIVNARKFTELEIARQTIEDSAAELHELNATKDKFFSIIAHDLKSPYNSILGFSEVLAKKSREKDHAGAEKYANIILQSSHRALNLLVNLLEWSRSQTGRLEFKPEHFDLVDFINETARFFNDSSTQKNISIKTETPGHVSVYADKHMVSAVMRNLTSNAIKFTREGGEVVIQVEEKHGEVVVSVCDTGIGIAPERIDKLFRIDQADSTAGTNKETGTGLGLILCKEFVEKHGGRIWVESLENEGSTFSFTLPGNHFTSKDKQTSQ